MNSKERFMTALEVGIPDKVPIFESYINDSSLIALGKLMNERGIEAPVPETRSDEKDTFGIGAPKEDVLDLYCFLVSELRLDATCYNFSIGLERVGKDRGRDKYGRVYRLSEHGEPFPIQGPVEKEEDLLEFEMVSKLRQEDFRAFRYIVDRVEGEKVPLLTITDPFKVSWRSRGGMEELLMDYVRNPQFVHDLARISTDFDLAVIDMVTEIEPEVVILMTGDLAGEDTTIMSPESYREFIRPYHQEIVDYVHGKGGRIIKHTDGNAWPILDDFLQVGFDGFHPVQPQCMDIAEVKEHLSGQMCILGNIDCRNLLPFGTEEEVKRVVEETIAKAAPGGGYIVSSSNSIHPGVEPKNYLAMVETVHRYGSG